MRIFAIVCVAAFFLTAGCANSTKKELFSSEKANDHIAAVIEEKNTAETSSASISQPLLETSSLTKFQPMQIETYPERDTYPVGTQEIVLVVTNHAQQDLLYSEWFDFRRVEKEQLIPLEPRENEMIYQGGESLVLKAGERVSLKVPINIFKEPLSTGVYRISQLACYAENFACTEITTEFTLE